MSERERPKVQPGDALPPRADDQATHPIPGRKRAVDANLTAPAAPSGEDDAGTCIRVLVHPERSTAAPPRDPTAPQRAPMMLPAGTPTLPSRDGSPPTRAAAAAAPNAMTLLSAQPVKAPDDGLVTGVVLAGKYEVIRLLGAGGMGRVYKGQHLSLGVPVAIKTMSATYAALPDYVRRFHREAHAASLLNHPNVVRVLDFGEDRGLLFLVMEYLDGQSLSRYLERQKGPPPLSEVAEIMAMLLDAFDVAHAFGVVHRDLKPENIFLTEVGKRRMLKVLDFGLAHVDDARDTGPTLTSKDVVAGTPEYMSPEQCRSLAVGPSADIYSIGCVLTTLLQLRPPFRMPSAMDTLAKHMFSPPPPLDRPASAEKVPPLLEKLRLDLLAKKPERRPRDAAEAKARLLEAMSQEAEEKRLPTRKGDTPGGDRSERAPAWDEGHLSPPPGGTLRLSLGAREVAWLRAGPPGEQIDAECETGLAMQEIALVPVASVAEVRAQARVVVVLDVGSDLAAARARLGELAAEAPEARVVVCAAGLSVDRIRDLVAAGAADVVRYPVTPDALARKLERVLRRGR
jgi:eukaryotic-like serine/threonine-protein kinase